MLCLFGLRLQGTIVESSNAVTILPCHVFQLFLTFSDSILKYGKGRTTFSVEFSSMFVEKEPNISDRLY